LGPEDFIVYENDSFSAIQVSEPGEGTNINKACFGQNVYERRVINFTAAPSGDPPKFSYKVNQGGVGWTSLYFKQGNDFCSCPIAGPDFLEDRYVKPVIHFVLFGKTRVRFEINFENCSYRAFQETDENGDPIAEVELTQFPVTNIKITIDGKTGPVRENESLTKCDLGAWVYGTGTCSTRCLGGWCVKIPLGCTP
jgi:hypothetical protein